MPRVIVACVAAICIALCASVSIPGGSMSDAEAAPAAKKASRKAQPSSQQRTAPDMTATIPQTGKFKGMPTAQPATPEPEDESIPPAFNLPTASRARMRVCGERWQEMKMSGEAKDQTWRAYATKCLASKDGPETVAHP